MDVDLHGWHENQLRNARPALDRERLGSEIREDDVHFAAIISVECAGRVSRP